MAKRGKEYKKELGRFREMLVNTARELHYFDFPEGSEPLSEDEVLRRMIRGGFIARADGTTFDPDAGIEDVFDDVLMRSAAKRSNPSTDNSVKIYTPVKPAVDNGMQTIGKYTSYVYRPGASANQRHPALSVYERTDEKYIARTQTSTQQFYRIRSEFDDIVNNLRKTGSFFVSDSDEYKDFLKSLDYVDDVFSDSYPGRAPEGRTDLAHMDYTKMASTLSTLQNGISLYQNTHKDIELSTRQQARMAAMCRLTAMIDTVSRAAERDRNAQKQAAEGNPMAAAPLSGEEFYKRELGTKVILGMAKSAGKDSYRRMLTDSSFFRENLDSLVSSDGFEEFYRAQTVKGINSIKDMSRKELAAAYKNSPGFDRALNDKIVKEAAAPVKSGKKAADGPEKEVEQQIIESILGKPYSGPEDRKAVMSKLKDHSLVVRDDDGKTLEGEDAMDYMIQYVMQDKGNAKNKPKVTYYVLSEGGYWSHKLAMEKGPGGFSLMDGKVTMTGSAGNAMVNIFLKSETEKLLHEMKQNAGSVPGKDHKDLCTALKNAVNGFSELDIFADNTEKVKAIMENLNTAAEAYKANHQGKSLNNSVRNKLMVADSLQMLNEGMKRCEQSKFNMYAVNDIFSDYTACKIYRESIRDFCQVHGLDPAQAILEKTPDKTGKTLNSIDKTLTQPIDFEKKADDFNGKVQAIRQTPGFKTMVNSAGNGGNALHRMASWDVESLQKAYKNAVKAAEDKYRVKEQQNELQKEQKTKAAMVKGAF